MEAAWLVATATMAVVVLAGLRWLHEWVQEHGLGEKRRHLPPGDMGWPVVGKMFAFLKAFKSGDPDSFVNSFVRRFGGVRIYKTYMFGSPAIMVVNPDACKHVLMDDEHFIPGWPASTRQLMGKHSFVDIVNEEHKRLRRLTAAPINGFEALNTYLFFIEHTVISTLEKWAGMGEIEFLTELRRFTFRIIMKIFLSEEGESEMQMLERVYTDLNYGVRAMAINLPGFAFHRALKARKVLVDTLQGILDRRRETRARNVYPAKKDMMDNLIDVEDDNGRRLSDEEIIDILIMYLNAGHESSGHITMWATVFLQENPDMFATAKAEQEEIRRNMPPGQKGLTLNEVRKMKYLSKVIDETLRLVNISFVNFREATKDVYLKGYLIPKGWKVQLWFRSIHLDTDVYTNPKKFNPSRWDDFTPKAGGFVPFGGGSRLCPGNELAKLEISVFLHHFLLGYKLIRKNPKGPVRYLPHPRPIDNCLAKVIKLHEKSV
ncbi:ent-kaurenoic acid oxidase [Canna indica]|uniref:Ent-kaurenoic acid oxidase n=1 Tax=Canna indica TaxID=4628 RepID=A0AAQ3KFU1_9LILI|nr:ent-kaurenoic acid oxidase [Canna indica]